MVEENVPELWNLNEFDLADDECEWNFVDFDFLNVENERYFQQGHDSDEQHNYSDGHNDEAFIEVDNGSDETSDSFALNASLSDCSTSDDDLSQYDDESVESGDELALQEVTGRPSSGPMRLRLMVPVTGFYNLGSPEQCEAGYNTQDDTENDTEDEDDIEEEIEDNNEDAIEGATINLSDID